MKNHLLTVRTLAVLIPALVLSTASNMSCASEEKKLDATPLMAQDSYAPEAAAMASYATEAAPEASSK